MSEIIDKCKQLLDSGEVKLIIGYGKGTNKYSRPLFVTKESQLAGLIFDEQCSQNLAVYLNKPEIKKFAKSCLLGGKNTLKAILQLAAENQIVDDNLIVLTNDENGKIVELKTISEIENYISQSNLKPNPDIRQKLDDLSAKSREEKWDFWVNELSKCIKCYACRAACPLCYCTRCTVEMNQPQWIPLSAHTLGNFEWHINRIMHLAGRCISCGQCTEACPMDIPLNLLLAKVNIDNATQFGQRPGMKAEPDYVLNTYKVDDKENFIR